MTVTKKVSFLKCLLLLLMVIASFCFASRALGEEEIHLLSPGEKHFAGKNLYFHIQLIGFYEPKSVTVYYRYIGGARYKKLTLKKETSVDFTGIIPGEKLVPPGIEYFVKVVDGRGYEFTLPPRDPEKNPRKIPISLDNRPPEIGEVIPGDGESVDTTRPEIRVIFKDRETRVDTSSVRVFLDGSDVTRKCRISESTVVFKPAGALTYGSHKIAVDVADLFGNRAPRKEWTFIIQQTSKLDSASVSLKFDGEGRLKVVEKKSSTSPDWAIQSHAGLETNLKKGDFSFKLNGNAWYREEDGPGPEDDRFNLTDYLAELRFGKAYLRVGDVSLNLTELSGASLSRRGTTAGIEEEDYELVAFSARSNYVTGFNGGIGAFNPDQRIHGGKAKGTIIKPLDLTLTVLFLTGRNESPGGYGVTTTEAPSEGNLFTIGLDGKIRGETLSFSSEYTSSRFDEDITQPGGKVSDSAWKVKLSSRGEGYDVSAGVKYLGPDFSTVVSPTSVKDRITYFMGWGLGSMPINVRFNLSLYEDNVDRDPSIPVIRNKSGTVRVNYISPNKFTLFSGYSLTAQDSRREPALFNSTEQITHIVNAGASLTAERLSFSPIYTYTKVNDRSQATNNDSETHTLSASVSYRPSENVSLSPVFSYTNIRPRSTGLTTETLQSALSGTVSLMDGKLSLNTTVSWVDSNGSEGLSHTVVWSGICQVNMKMEDIFFHYGTQTLSLRGQYSQNEDRVNRTAARDYSVYLVISFGFPVNISGGPQGGGN